MTEPTTYLRSATLTDMVALLRTQHARRLDAVVPASALRMRDGLLVVAGAEATISEDGVTATDGLFSPTAICLDGLGERLGPDFKRYLSRCINTNPELADANVNSWLAHPTFADKNFLIRMLRSDDPGTPGVARAILSDVYKPVDNLDVLMTVLEGIKEAGVEVDIRACNLTDRRMYVQFACEQVAINAQALVERYRSPFNGKSGKDLPMIFAGFEVSNSEIGQGRVSIAPRLIVQVCNNGMTRRIDAFEAQHLGQKLKVGVIEWSDETQRRNLELIKSKTADAVKKFLSPEYVQAVVDELMGQAGVEVAKPQETIQFVTKELRYTEAQQDAILAMFIKGGDLTAGGVMQAVTAAAQEERDADVAADMEADAFRVLELAAKHATTTA